MKTFCPHCMDDTTCEVKDLKEVREIRGENFTTITPVVICKSCGNDFNNAAYPERSIPMAFQMYRERHHLMHPEEVYQARVKKNFSFKELADLSEIFPERLRMIEQGALITKEEDASLRRVLI